MIRLHRTVRFAVGKGGDPESPNGFAGRPAFQGLDRHYELFITCRGEIDPVASYLIDIKEIDRAAHASVIPAIRHAALTDDQTPPCRVLRSAFPALNRALAGRVESVRWNLSPYYSMEIHVNHPTTALLRQRFDFAASHRLHVPSLSDEENRALFGKCNNKNGHGHNYQFEACVRVEIDRDGRHAFTLRSLEDVAQRTLIERFDHKHLNEDTPEFAHPGGVMPSVENIAQVFYRLLSGAIAAQTQGASLATITVWETDRTSATYPA